MYMHNRWFRMDDASVKPCTEDEAMHQNAYILFYQTKQHVMPRTSFSPVPVRSMSSSLEFNPSNIKEEEFCSIIDTKKTKYWIDIILPIILFFLI